MEKKQVIITRQDFRGLQKIFVEVGSDCFIGKCGGFRSVFGENGKVTKISDRYIYCTSESGSIVKYNIEKDNVCGKWLKEYYFVNFNTIRIYCTPENHTETIKSRPSVWNSDKCVLEFK